MKKILTIGALCLLSLSCTQTKKPADPKIYGDTITETELKELLYKYASDEFEGRETGEPGQKMAVNYLKDQYVEMGIPSAYGTDNYFQEIPLERQLLADVDLKINGKKALLYDEYIPPRNVNVSDLSISEIVYLGYGIDTDTYSDYKTMDVKGKYVIMKAGEPMNPDSTYVTSGTKGKTQWTSGRRARNLKIETAEKHGAKAVFFLDDATVNYYSKYYKNIDPNTYEGRIAAVSNDNDSYSFIINNSLANQIVPDIDSNHTPRTVETDLQLSMKKNIKPFTTENVVAYIEGEEKPDEVLVISAHLDHLGIEDGVVSNGADDDGSGTVAMLEIAEAFQKAVNEGYRPKRSILFLHLTGEEKGLLGSKHYTDISPVFPLENTISNLNIDMIGRVDKLHEDDRNYVYVIGSDMLSTELHDINEKANATYTNINLDYRYSNETDPNRYYYRSDHYNFAKNNIPVIFYFNGTHEDYHKPTDTPDKIQYDLLEKRTRLVFYTAWELVNRENRVIVDKATK
ncbi:M28 family peptidase [Psychroserpens sp. XS_ASV72]|uniref:M28 family peptidase n=1 Tax=Psychroserpens sp. XS_ASV72 TaxID=3241293 RepID=UPI003514B8D3